MHLTAPSFYCRFQLTFLSFVQDNKNLYDPLNRRITKKGSSVPCSP
jgi:hypothetical protein